uniref:Uncharacterized protein n=1 Tax=Romanomermis culicivorax TaxID=13658 RepID=A0A915L8N4_ROMCU
MKFGEAKHFLQSRTSYGISNYVGQEITIRKCVTQSDLTTFGYPDREGCGDVSDFSVKGYGCVCKDECKEPMSSKGPSSTAFNSTTAAPKKSAKNATTPAAAKKPTHSPTTPKPKSFFFF